MFPAVTSYFRYFLILCNRDYGMLNYELNNQMSEQIPSILVTLTVLTHFSTFIDLTRTKNTTLKSTKTLRNKKT